MNAVLKAAVTYWPKVSPVLKPARTKADYERLVLALDYVLDAGGADEKHALASLAGYLGALVSEYENAHSPFKEIGVPDLPRELMEQHGLTQSQLPEIGPRSVVSAILAGKRQLNVRQIARLARRFKLPADVFMP
ncbi:MAG: helix-turn-helix domain-containing protein [Gammaproteobacteria bacterium]